MKRLKGFTLVELVITIAIVIILSVVSVPIYRGYTKNAKMSEGYAVLGTILSAQKTYYSQYGNFLSASNSSSRGMTFTCNDEVLGIDLRGNKYFTAFRYTTAVINDLKIWFRAALIKPEELANGENMKLLRLSYNITEGASYDDNNSIGDTGGI